MKSQTGNLSNNERIGSAIVGAVLSVLALRRGNPVFRTLEAAAGASLLARSVAGHCAVKAAMRGDSPLSEGLRDQWSHMSFSGLAQMVASAVGTARRAEHASRSRAVDESVDQSFPASDPPASRLPDEPPSNAEAKWAAARAAKKTVPPF